MGRKLPIEVRNCIIAYFDAGKDVSEVHEAIKVSKSFLYKLRLNFDPLGNTIRTPNGQN
jgi:hypothetical protein